MSLEQPGIGTTTTFFFKVTDAGGTLGSLCYTELWPPFVDSRSISGRGWRLINPPALLYHFSVARLVCRHLRFGGEHDGRNIGGMPCTSRAGVRKKEGRQGGIVSVS